jgi:hypothetical protein
VSPFLRSPSTPAAAAGPSRDLLPQRVRFPQVCTTWFDDRVMSNAHAANEDVLQDLTNRWFALDVRLDKAHRSFMFATSVPRI